MYNVCEKIVYNIYGYFHQGTNSLVCYAVLDLQGHLIGECLKKNIEFYES